MLVVGAWIYTAVPSAHDAAGRSLHRHADGVMHAHPEAEAVPEREADALHDGRHAHGGRVHTHGLLAHSHETAPEAVVQRVALRGIPARLGAEVVVPTRDAGYVDRPRLFLPQAHPSVETPPPIGRG